jgi:hypothetical protein
MLSEPALQYVFHFGNYEVLQTEEKIIGIAIRPLDAQTRKYESISASGNKYCPSPKRTNWGWGQPTFLFKRKREAFPQG